MGMLDNLFRLCRMSDVIVQFLLQIGKVILNLNIVIIGNQLSFHKPGFTGRTRHYGNGVGRQMFIYAFYMRMKKHYSNTRIDLSDMVHYKAHNGYEMHRVFNLPPIEFRINQPLKKVIEFLFFKKIYERKQIPSSLVPYDKKYFWPLLYFKGFYQSERFFADMADDIRKAFTFNPRLSNRKTKEMSEQIDHDENAVSIHVRRGDYLEPKYWKTTGCVCQLPYYLNAIAEMNKRISQPSYYVFSDDIAWVKENLPLPKAFFIDWNKGTESWQDMMLMSRCRHHIICNSTFSWWGAWLNPRENKTVIMPERWFRHCETPDICPDKWIKVPINQPDSIQ